MKTQTKKIIALVALAVVLAVAFAGTAQASSRTFVKRGHVATVEFGPGSHAASGQVRCPASSSPTSGYVSFVNDGTPFGVSIVAQDITVDEQGWGATVMARGLYSAGEEVTTARFIVNVICIREGQRSR